MTSRGRHLPAAAGGPMRSVLTLGVVVTLGLVLLPWWRNHDSLRDFYDYGVMMNAAGRLNAGEKPYVEFATPLQTLPLLVQAGAERIWGERYLALTYAQAVWLAGLAAALAGLLWRAAGPALALVTAAAVTQASAGQHTIPWYNAMGVTWLAFATWLVARPPAGWRPGVTIGSVAVFLWLSGMTKINYHAATLAFCVLLAARLVRSGDWSRGDGAVALLAWGLAGLAAPPLTEMGWTGADWATWRENVFGIAAGRAGLLRELLAPQFYLRPAHDHYHPVFLPWMGAWTVLLVGAVTWAAWRPAAQRGGRSLFLAAVGGTLCCGLVLIATNIDIIHLGGASTLVMGTAVLLAFADERGSGLARRARVVLAIGAVSLVVPATASAWQGARALWGRGPTDRAELVRADTLPPRFAYFRGLRIPSAWHDSLAALAERVDGGARPPQSYHFANGTEWLLRAFPEARRTGLPLWLHYGTTYGPANAAEIGARFRGGGDIEVLVADRAWDVWFAGLEDVIRRYYSPTESGPLLILYVPHAEPERLMHDDPVGFAARTDSNVFSRDLRQRTGWSMVDVVAGQTMVAASRSHELSLGPGFFRLEGEMHVVSDRPVAVRLQVTSDDGRDLLWDENFGGVVTGHRTARFAVSPGGRSVVLRGEFAGPGAHAGWRAVRTWHAGPVDTGSPGPLQPRVARFDFPGSASAALFASPSAAVTVSAYGAAVSPQAGGASPGVATRLPGELWFPRGDGGSRLAGWFALAPGDSSGSGGSFRVVYYKSGRFEVLLHRDLRPGVPADEGEHRFDVALPEPGGWVGLVAAPLVAEEAAPGEARWGGIGVR